VPDHDPQGPGSFACHHLVRALTAAVRVGDDTGQSVAPLMLAHPHDPGVILGNLYTDPAAAGADAVVSLCRIGRDDLDDVAANRVSAWLVDQAGVCAVDATGA
jgi:hypothetical protein